MHGAGQFFGEQSIDPSLTGDSRFPDENRRDDMHVKMRFSLRSRARMAGMTMRLVADRQSGGMQPGRELGMEAISDAHDHDHDEGSVKVAGRTVKC